MTGVKAFKFNGDEITPSDRSIAMDSIIANEGMNVFLFEGDELADAPLFIDNIVLSDTNYLYCFKASQKKVMIKLTGQGDGTLITVP